MTGRRPFFLSRTVKNPFLLFSHLVCGLVLQQLKGSDTVGEGEKEFWGYKRWFIVPTG